MDSNNCIEALAALAQPTRLETFRLLVKAGPEGLPAGEIARHLEIPANTLSAHLTILNHAGLVEARRAGRSIFYSAHYTTMRDLLNYLTEDCCQGHPEITGAAGKPNQAATDCCPDTTARSTP